MSIDVEWALEQSNQEEFIGERVVTAVADANDVDVTDLDVRLYDIVDPDALERLFRPRADGIPRARGQVVFEMAGCTVVVHSDGDVEVAA